MVLELIQLYPRTSIIVLALAVSFFVSLVNYFFLDKKRMHEIKARQKTIQDEMKLHKDNPAKVMELQKEMFSHVGESFKHSFKPMLITLIPILFIFAFFRKEFLATEIAKSWIWYYIGSSIVGSMIFRKILKLP